MSKKEELRKMLMTTLNECLAFGQRPDEYQARHNLLARQTAALLLHDEIMKEDGEDE